MELNRTLSSCLERKCLQRALRGVLDHYFNVHLDVSGREMELTRTCCFEFDRKLQEGGKQLVLHTFCLFFRVAGFTYLLPLPEVDKISEGIPTVFLYFIYRH